MAEREAVWKRWTAPLKNWRPRDGGGPSARLARVGWYLGAAIWLGSMVFFCFVVTPTIFWRAPSAVAITVIRHLFPLYYGLGLWVGGVALVGAWYLGVWEGRWHEIFKALMTTLAWAVTFFTVQHLLPLLTEASASPAGLAAWSHWSISLNLCAMGALAVAMGIDAAQKSARR